MKKTVLVLGAYGNFGSLICEQLAQRPDIELLVAGRNKQKAEKFCLRLQNQGAVSKLKALVIDIEAQDFLQVLLEIKPFMVIHTSGPFQGQDYRVANACIEAGSHYIDLADDRRFVCDFDTLDSTAKNKAVIAITGASSVPGLSSVVVDKLARDFSQLEEIDYCIVPGSNVELGVATLKGILSYIGQPFTIWEQGKSKQVYCWVGLRRIKFAPPLGTRWLADVDIPDLSLFPKRYPEVKTVRFQAGHELGFAHLSLAFIANLSKLGLFTQWDKYADHFYSLGQKIKVLGSDTGGMVIRLCGINHDNIRQTTNWRLIAKNGVGPRIPTISTIILSHKILDEELVSPGARSCLGMYSLEEFFNVASKWGIYSEEDRLLG